MVVMAAAMATLMQVLALFPLEINRWIYKPLFIVLPKETSH